MLNISVKTPNGRAISHNVNNFVNEVLGGIGITEAEILINVAFSDEHCHLEKNGIRFVKWNITSLELVIRASNDENYRVFIMVNGGDHKKLHNDLVSKFGKIWWPGKEPQKLAEPIVADSAEVASTASPSAPENPSAPAESRAITAPVADVSPEKSQEAPAATAENHPPSTGRIPLTGFIYDERNIDSVLLAIQELGRNSKGLVHYRGLGVSMVNMLNLDCDGKAMGPVLQQVAHRGFLQKTGSYYRLTVVGEQRLSEKPQQQVEQVSAKTTSLAFTSAVHTPSSQASDSVVQTKGEVSSLVAMAMEFKKATAEIQKILPEINSIEKEIVNLNYQLENQKNRLQVLNARRHELSAITTDPAKKAARETLIQLRELFASGNSDLI